MRRLLITVVFVLAAAHLVLGAWALANADAMGRTIELFRGGGAEVAQHLDHDAWRSDVHATGGTLVVIGAVTLLAGIAILARWSWALAGWLAVVSFTTAFHVLWCVMDWGRGGADTADVALTVAIMALCVFSWVRFMRPDGQAALLGESPG
jgi:hypothetical protein